MDSDLSASELRKRYQRGGTIPDDALSSAQLRARHAIPSNSKDFAEGGRRKAGNGMSILLICLILAILLVVLYFYISTDES
ncbi:hypothetical protein B484DRAFT_190184 [Ochromonadaceae sp. CCMP2298]|nr:hypothetical protein B484DRAFT_190184 [Ochromonadaceae sp. CCMP2298]